MKSLLERVLFDYRETKDLRQSTVKLVEDAVASMTSTSLPSGKISEAMVEAAYREGWADAINAESNASGGFPHFEDADEGWSESEAKAAALSVPAPGTGGAEPVGEYGAVEAAINEARRLEQAGVGAGAAAPSVIRAYLDALSTPPAGDMGTVKVKPLEWRDGSLINSQFADCTVGRYSVLCEIETTHNGLLPAAWIDPRGEHHEVASREAAKAAAQTDYTSRILSALSSTPVGEMDGDTKARVLSELTDRRLLNDVDPSLFDEIAAALVRAVSP